MIMWQANQSYQKIAKAELTSVNKKFVYHIANIFFKVIKFLICFILFSSRVHVQKTQLQGQHLNAKDVIDKLDIDNISKPKLWYRKF
jgi:hypothetical protein